MLTSSPTTAQLRAAAAAVEITPPAGSLLYGYGARGTNRSEGIHDPLYARALVLEAGGETAALVTLDLGSIRKENTLPVRRAVLDAAGFDHVLLNASHTHSAPLFEADFPNAESPWVRELERKIVSVVLEAHAVLRPARIAVGWGRASEGHNRRRVLPDGSVEMFWRNRERLPTAPLDESVGVLAIDGTDGEPIATVVNFAVHPVILGPGNMLVSADYPGAMAALVAGRGGGVPMFLQGAAGDINPFWDKTPPAEGGFEQVRMAGERLGHEVAPRPRRPGRGGSLPRSGQPLREAPPGDARPALGSGLLRWSRRAFGVTGSRRRSRDTARASRANGRPR